MGEECCGHDHSSEDVLEATIIEDSVGSSFDFSRRLEKLDSRYLLGGGVAVVALVLMLILSILWTAAGPSIAGEGDEDWWNTPVDQRHTAGQVARRGLDQHAGGLLPRRRAQPPLRRRL